MVHAAKTLAATGLSLLTSPDLLAQAKAEWRDKTKTSAYVCPIPAAVKPGKGNHHA
jgi:aminobenzoyl-glutamate utilization protein B